MYISGGPKSRKIQEVKVIIMFFLVMQSKPRGRNLTSSVQTVAICMWCDGRMMKMMLCALAI